MTSTGLAALATVDMVISRGADNPYKFIYSTSDGATPPVVTPVNLTGWTAHAQVRTFVNGPIWCDLLSPSTGIVLGADGSILVTIAHAVTSVVAWDAFGTGVWDLELTSPTGTVVRFLQGTVTLSQDVTR
jgi:hypothetical protein